MSRPRCLDGVFGWLARLAARVAALRFRLLINVVCVGGSHRHQMEKRSMKHYAGLDVSVKEASVCIVDETGKVCREVKVMSHPEELIRALKVSGFSACERDLADCRFGVHRADFG